MEIIGIVIQIGPDIRFNTLNMSKYRRRPDQKLPIFYECELLIPNAYILFNWEIRFIIPVFHGNGENSFCLCSRT